MMSSRNPENKPERECTLGNTFNVCMVHYEEVYPPRSGAQVRTFEFARNLRLLKHRVVVIQLSKKAKCVETFSPLGSLGPTIISLPIPWIIRSIVNASRRPATQKALSIFLINILPFYLFYLLRTIIAEDVDIVQAEGLSMSLPSLLLGRLLKKVAILDDQNAETLLANRLYCFSRDKKNQSLGLSSFSLLLWQKFVLVVEKASCIFAHLVIVPSPIDADFLVKQLKASPKRTTVIPNGVTLESEIRFEHIIPILREKLGISDGAEIITFVGNMSFPPNLYAVKWIIGTLSPELARMRPMARIMIVGPLSSEIVDPLPENVILTGEVSDVVPYIEVSDVCIAPLSVGAGTKVKILYYLASGKPVIATSVGAEGLENCCLVESELSEFARKIALVLDDDGLKKRLEKEGRRYVANFDWRILAKGLVAYYDSLVTCM